MHRAPRPILFLFVLLAISLGQPGLAAGTGPLNPARPPGGGVPPGSVVLPNGRILPPQPSGLAVRSEMASELLAHESEHIAFTPGARPQPLQAPSTGVATGELTLADPSGSSIRLLPLAPSDGSGAQATLAAALPNGLKKQVFGFLPYWMLDASDLQWMRYDLLSTIAYFGVAARSDGSLATNTTGWSGWNSTAMTSVIDAAHRKGDRVVLTVTMMAWDAASANAQAALLNSATYRARLVTNIVAAVRNRSADGVNLDFEPLATSLRSQYTAFVRQLKAALLAARVGSYLTVCTTAGAATWASGYDLAGLTASGASDGIFAMGYDYSWSGSSRAGGVDPMESSYMLDVNQSVTDFLSMMPASKLIWGVPYYGRTWHTTSSALNAATVAGASGSSSAYYYTGAKSLAAAHGRRWDSLGQVPWFTYYDNVAKSWIQGYYDDPTSLGVKYDMINRRGLAGVGMWHLLMDGGVSELWNLVANKFQKDTLPPTGGITNLPATTDSYAIRVGWRAIDVGSGVASYSVQVRDRSLPTWTSLASGTTTTSLTYLGVVGHLYEFRVAAKDRLGNTQAWIPAMANPGSSLAPGGFATVLPAALNVRSGAGTGFDSLIQLVAGQRVGVIAGPVPASGYQWYEVQFGFTEWPSADYPRLGWVAAGDSSGPFIVPATSPTVTSLSPQIGAYAPSTRLFSPNGDGRSDTASASFSLPRGASSVRLDVLAVNGSAVDSVSFGPMAAGAHTVTWNGRTSSGTWATGGTYLLRIATIDAAGLHVAPSSFVDATILGRWGVTADVTAPTVVVGKPAGYPFATSSLVTTTFSEQVTGVGASTVSLTDTTVGAPVPASVDYQPATRTATLAPSSLAAGHTFRVSLGSGIRDLAGNALTPMSWTFTTTALVTTYSPARMLSFQAGTTTGYRFDAYGHVIGAKAYTLSAASNASATTRSRAVVGHAGAWFYVVNGIWAGYWVPESVKVYLPGVSELALYNPDRTVTFAAGTHTGYRFWSTWQVSQARSYALAGSSSSAADRLAVINGKTYVYVINGIWAGYWVPIGTGVTVS